MFEGFTENDIVAFHVKDFMQLAKDIETAHNELIDKRAKAKEQFELMEKQVLAYKVTFEILAELFKKAEKLDIPGIARESLKAAEENISVANDSNSESIPVQNVSVPEVATETSAAEVLG